MEEGGGEAVEGCVGVAVYDDTSKTKSLPGYLLMNKYLFHKGAGTGGTHQL